MAGGPADRELQALGPHPVVLAVVEMHQHQRGPLVVAGVPDHGAGQAEVGVPGSGADRPVILDLGEPLGRGVGHCDPPCYGEVSVLRHPPGLVAQAGHFSFQAEVASWRASAARRSARASAR
nr:hypothetical protein GCM10020093_083970 [Planobispora longispora]